MKAKGMVDGQAWFGEKTNGHKFGPTPGTPNRNNNLLLQLSSPLTLNLGPGVVVSLPVGTEVVIYQKFRTHVGSTVVATFFTKDEQITFYGGSKLRRRSLRRGSSPRMLSFS